MTVITFTDLDRFLGFEADRFQTFNEFSVSFVIGGPFRDSHLRLKRFPALLGHFL